MADRAEAGGWSHQASDADHPNVNVRMQGGRAARHSDHHRLLLGPPWAAKSMLARPLTTILPAMTLTEAIETTRIHRVAGLTGDRTALVMTRPGRAPHHTISDVGLIAGATCRCRATCRGRTMV